MLVPGGQYQGPILMQSAATEDGNGTAVNCTENDNGAYTALAVQVTGISNARVNWEATIDGTNWAGIMATPLETGTAATYTEADGIFRITVLGLLKVRARISNYAAGTISVTAYAVA